MIILLLIVNMLFYPIYYQQSVDKVVNKFNLSIFFICADTGFWGYILHYSFHFDILISSPAYGTQSTTTLAKPT